MKQFRMMDEQMARVPKAYFLDERPLPFDVFIRLGRDRFVQVARAGTRSHIHQLRAFESDLVSWFYVHQGDFPVYLNERVDEVQILIGEKSPLSASMEAAGRAVGAVLELIRVGGVTPAGWSATQRLSEALLKVVMTKPIIGQGLDAMGVIDAHLVRHSIFVAVIALSVAEAEGVDAAEMTHLASASLLHDVGYLRLPEDVLDVQLEDLTETQRQIFHRHPHEGASMLKDCSQVPSEVVALVYEHHENATGTGFPRALGEDKLSRSSLILALSERFAELTIGDSLHVEKHSLQAAINIIATTEGPVYPTSMIKALASIIKPST